MGADRDLDLVATSRYVFDLRARHRPEGASERSCLSGLMRSILLTWLTNGLSLA